MNLVFQLSMPGSPSWNGKWSGEGKLYAIVKSFSSQKAKSKAREILAKHWYSYSWSDGWRASIEVRECDAREARIIRGRSAGMAGYDWMVQSILDHGSIKADHEIAKVAP